MTKSSPTYHLPIIVFSLVLLWGGLVSAKSLRPLVPLYQDAHLRSQVQNVIQRFADNNGFLLSSIRIESLEGETVHVLVREYRKGRDSKTPYSIPLFLP